MYIESFGCAMNFSDSEIIESILSKVGYIQTSDISNADLIFLNTCSIRDKAEQTVRTRIKSFKNLKNKNSKLKIGVLGCMAERLKNKLSYKQLSKEEKKQYWENVDKLKQELKKKKKDIFRRLQIFC